MSGVQLRFDPNFSSLDYRLLEVDATVLQQIEENRGSVSFKGARGASSEAVLCTATATYAVRTVETTNACLLVPSRSVAALQQLAASSSSSSSSSSQLAPSAAAAAAAAQPAAAVQHVAALVGRHLELSECQPQLHLLRDLLSQRPYAGQLEESKPPGTAAAGCYSWEELRRAVPASAEQLRTALADLHAFELHGKWRVLADEYAERLLELLLDEATINDWPLSSLSERGCIAALSQQQDESDVAVEELCVRQCLAVYSSGPPADGPAAAFSKHRNDRIWSLDLKKVCIFRAVQLLKKNGKKGVPLDRFLAEWAEAAPTASIASDLPPLSLDLLLQSGVAVVVGEGTAAVVSHLDAASLPRDARARFQQLFSIKSSWSTEELAPFVRDLVPPKSSLEQFLNKFGKFAQTPQGRRFMSRLA